MRCSPSQVPEAAELDIDQLKARYRQQRDRRIRSDGQQQYQRTSGSDDGTYAHDPHQSVTPREAIHEDLEVAVLGAGWSGLLTSVHLRKAGVAQIRNIDHAGDFGGVWYWNRYPGVQCDNDAYCYLPMLEEMGFMPSQKFCDGHEIYRYCQSIARRFDLYENALFHTRVTALRWDESIRRWQVSTNRGDEIRARFVVMANGGLNIPKLPAIPGLSEYAGKVFHTARWDYGYTGGSHTEPELSRLGDKRVAIVGTGATAVQAIPALAHHAKQLYVLQRTPSAVDHRPNPKTDINWSASLSPGWQQARIANFHRFAIAGPLPGEQDLICDFWTEINRNLNEELLAEGIELSLEDYLARREVMDYRVMERLRRRIATMVDDPKNVSMLTPWFRFFCKRPLSSNAYYPVFNRDNVSLFDVSATQGVERVTANGFVVDDVEYAVDCIIFASGFEVTSDLDRRWGIDVITGRDGQSLYTHWDDGYTTYHGMATRGFPNLLFVGFYQGGFNATTTETYNRQGEHIAYIVREALSCGVTALEPELAAEAEWVTHVRATAFDVSDLQRECTPSYFNNEGQAHIGKDGKPRHRWYLGEAYGPGWDAFQQLLGEWREQGDLRGFELRTD